MRIAILWAGAVLISIFGCGSLITELDKARARIAGSPLVFSPVADTYYTTQNVTISGTDSSTICYTIDGSTPSCSNGSCGGGFQYSGPVTVAATQTIRAVVCRVGADNPLVNSASYVIDTSLPIIVSSTPAPAATNVPPCSGTPCDGRIKLVFNKKMNSSLIPALTMDIFDGTVYQAVSVTASFNYNTTTVTDDTLVIRPSWNFFPEKSQIQYTLTAGGLKDVGGNQIAANVVRSFTTGILTVHYPVPDTGITSCYDAASVMACPVGGFPAQDASFSGVPNARAIGAATANATYSSDYTTKDTLTNLVWKTCAEGQTGSTCTGGPTPMNWVTAVNSCAFLNTANGGAGYAAIKNWRLATMKELETLPDYSISSPVLAIGSFPGATGTNFWTASGYAPNQSAAWFFDQTAGNSGNAAKTITYAARCVATATAPAASAMVDNLNGTISDQVTNLVWTKCPMDNSGTLLTFASGCTNAAVGGRTWANALNDCNGLALAGRTWRLPNFNELKSLVLRSTSSPAIDTALFPNTISSGYYTSSTSASAAGTAWTINFGPGSPALQGKGVTGAVRCVATGP